MMIRYILSIIGLLIIFSCSKKANLTTSDNTPKAEHIQPKPLARFITNLPQTIDFSGLDTLLFLKRSPCFGFCSAYDYTLFTNGIVRYMGYAHVDPIGEHYALLQESVWDTIIQEAHKITFFKLANRYPEIEENFIPDLPSTFIMLKDAGERKMIRDNHSPPKELKQLEVYIDAKLRSLTLESKSSNR